MNNTDISIPEIWQNLPVAVFLMTHEAVPHFITANATTVDLYGFENEEELKKLPVTGIFDDPMDLAEIFVTLQTEGHVSNKICRHKNKQGYVIWTAVSARNFTDKDGGSYCIVVAQDASEQKKLEKIFEWGKRQWETVFDTMSELTIITDLDHRILRCNQALSSRLGKHYKEIIGQDILRLFFGDELPETNPFEAGSREVHIPVLSADFLVTNNPLRNITVVLGLAHVMTDITQRKKSEAIIREKEALYRTMTERLPIGTYIAQDGCFRWVNERFTLNTGYTADDVLDRECLSLVHPDDRRAVRENAVAMLNGGDNLPYGYRTITKDGTVAWCIESVISMIYNGRRAVLGSQMDITDRKQAEEALKASEERYRTILDSIADGYYEVDLEGNNLFYNDQFLELRECSREEMYRSNYRSYMDDKNAEIAFKTFKEVFETGKHAKNVQLEWIVKDGKRKIIDNSVALIRDGSGKPVGFRGIARDVTLQRHNEMQELHSRKLESVGQLAAGIAHEINTPIQFVSDNIHFMRDAFEDITSLLSILDEGRAAKQADQALDCRVIFERIGEKEREIDMDYLREEIPKAIDQSLDGLQRVSRIVKAMREFSHPGGVEKTDIDINKSIESTITLTRNEWKYIADMATHLDSSLPMVKGYPADFNQVILNLIVNASQTLQEKFGKESREKGLIDISTRVLDSDVEICIRDTGMGIPPEAQARVFDPFFTTKDVGKGTGQGLAIAQNIIAHKHGGKIFFETKQGEGTSFFIRLPLQIT